ncbi:hypothetical protein Btru_050074 [Bulinus truncatus]|nr:hypothetical protein Btru_050074 [Bulinus truncatus]
MFKELLVLTFFIGVWQVETFSSSGECPDGHKPGDTWKKSNECSQCFCGSKGYTCRDCGNTLRVPPSKEKCYADFDNSLSFPKCCKLELVCEGDVDFDASRLFI